jgi:hypothetical protein
MSLGARWCPRLLCFNGALVTEESTSPRSAPTLHVDFHNADVEGRVRLTTRGTLEDVSRLPEGLREGLEVLLVDGELSTTGVVTWGHAEGIWVAAPNWGALRGG